MVENTKNKFLSIINKLNCMKCCQTDKPEPPTNTCPSSNLCCPYCKKGRTFDVITVVDKKQNSEFSYKWCHWCRKKSNQDIYD